MVAAEPDVVVHQLTALSGLGLARNFDKAFAMTNRLRTEGTDNLIAAARAAGARRLVWQSYAGWPYAREGGPIKSEDDELDPEPPADVRETLAAIRHLEAAVTGAEGMEGIVLRYGGFYGPGTSIDAGGQHVELIRKRRFPVGGDGAGIWSLVHIDDAAAATVAAIEGGAPGIYNVVDDAPAPIGELLPALAASVGAPPPRRLPGWLVRLAAGPQALLDDDPRPRRVEREGPRASSAGRRASPGATCGCPASTAGSRRTSRRARGRRARTRAWPAPRRAPRRCSACRAPRSRGSAPGSHRAGR